MWRFVIVLFATCSLAGCMALVGVIEDRLNGVAAANDPKLLAAAVPSDTQLVAHQRLFIADMHADTLLWGRDFRERGTRGHVDVPRLREGNVRLQVLTLVTKTPLGDGEEHPIRDTSMDTTALLSLVRGHRPQNWFSTRARALAQIEAFRDGVAKEPTGEVIFVRDVTSLRELMTRWRKDGAAAPVGLMLGVEGAHWFGEAGANELDVMIDELEGRGVKMVAPTHRFDNGLSGASEGAEQSGLTELGREVLRRMDARGFLIDLAHISPKGMDQALKLLKGPVVISHTGVWATTPRHRNLRPEEIRELARHGGVIGIGYWPQAVGKANLDYDGNYLDAIGDAFESALKALKEIKDIKGFDPYAHLGLGSDFDGAVFVPFDTARLRLLTADLMNRRDEAGAPLFPEEKLRLIYGLNFCRVLVTRWDQGKTRPEDICY